MASGYHTYEDDDKGFRVECTFEGSIVPYYPATFTQPAEGGHLEDVTFTVEEFFLTVGGQEFDMALALTDDLKAKLSEVVQDAHDKDTDVQSMLYEQVMSGGE